MPRSSPYRIDLSDEERAALDSMARSYTSPYWQVTRARMVLTVWRWLSEDAIKPWQHRSWIFPRDALFAEKAGRSLTSTPASGRASVCIPATT